ncbi:hypothetical protein [Janthinobacterium psychrotolerans]|uniref:Toxin CptA n=1 Tax=Janthinobacterium psychrotolerans TaxID=1747903 RepID=A0A1A7C8S3_9BURK|nr:hypothetical protein [Janthinobacterium psychrotolerans]OBV40718.1 hypothetical protein ASR47_101924 [Janthinobacterium psychrotolerans]
MSIAISAVLHTPVGLGLLQACLGLGAVLAAWPLAAGAYALGWPAALLSAAGGVLLLAVPGAVWRSCRKPHTLDISPVGQFRLTQHEAREDRFAPSTPPLRLLPGSTLWPALLVLRLADDDGRSVTVVVQRALPGMLAFRELAVACRAIAARGRVS